jgi:hypothetical protein
MVQHGETQDGRSLSGHRRYQHDTMSTQRPTTRSEARRSEAKRSEVPRDSKPVRHSTQSTPWPARRASVSRIADGGQPARQRRATRRAEAPRCVKPGRLPHPGPEPKRNDAPHHPPATLHLGPGRPKSFLPPSAAGLGDYPLLSGSGNRGTLLLLLPLAYPTGLDRLISLPLSRLWRLSDLPVSSIFFTLSLLVIYLWEREWGYGAISAF